jgi:hypothetical protein
MSDTGRMVPVIKEPLNLYDVTVTVAREDGYFPGPSEFGIAAGRAATVNDLLTVAAASREHSQSAPAVSPSLAEWRI